MNIKNMTTEELELMSHTDIAYNILKHEKKTLYKAIYYNRYFIISTA